MDLGEIEKKFPGKKVIVKNGRIILKDLPKARGSGRTKFSYIDMEKVREKEALLSNKGYIYIPYEVMSSKNSRVFEYVYSKAEKKKIPVLHHSAQYQEYVIMTRTYWAKNKARFWEMIEGKTPPYKVEFYFIRTTKGRFDYPNMMQGAMDLMVEHKWLADDHMELLMPYPGGYEVKREIQGLVISVL